MSEQEHDLDTTQENTSVETETLDTEERAYDLMFGDKPESETETEGSAENDVAEEGDESVVEEEATEEAETEEDAPEAEATEEAETETTDDQEGIEVPESFRDIKRDSLQTDEGKAVYDALSKAYQSMQADYTRKSQAIAGAEQAVLENEDTLRAIFRQANVDNPSHSDMIETAIGEFVALRTDAEYAKTVYQQLGQLVGETPEAEGESPQETTDPAQDIEQFKNEVRSELAARDEKEEIDRVANELRTEWEDVQSNEEFNEFSEDDWKLVIAAWANADDDSSAYAHAKALKSRYDDIAEKKAKEAEKKQQEYLKSKAQQPKVGAGTSGQNAQQTTPKPKSWEEADEIAEKMLGL